MKVIDGVDDGLCRRVFAHLKLGAFQPLRTLSLKTSLQAEIGHLAGNSPDISKAKTAIPTLGSNPLRGATHQAIDIKRLFRNSEVRISSDFPRLPRLRMRINYRERRFLALSRVNFTQKSLRGHSGVVAWFFDLARRPIEIAGFAR
jgi:hypothetical protein